MAKRTPYVSPKSKAIEKTFYGDEYLELPASKTQRASRETVKLELEDEKSNPETGSQSTRIVVTRRRQTRIYEPPSDPRQTYSRPFRLRRSFRRYRFWFFTGLGLALMLILIPLVQTFWKQNPQIVLRNTPISTPAGNATQATQIVKQGDHTLVITPPNGDYPPPAVFASAAYLLDADTGATLYAQNAFTHLPMLSTTKLMTALLAAEIAGDKLDQPISINDTVAKDLQTLSWDSALMGIKPGETYTLRELLYGALHMSGNDACIAIADGVAGSLDKFLEKMNQKAKALGMLDTHYVNPHGLMENGQYSSAHDLAVLGKASLSNPIVHEISQAKEYHISKTDQHAEHFMFNGNQFLWWYPGADGGKTGWDGAKNFNQVISVTRDNHHLIGVAMNTNDWWTDMRDLMNYGFNNFTWISPRDLYQKQTIPYTVDWNYFARDKKENTIPTADGGRYYIYTGYSLSGPFLEYYDKNGGLQKFGYPHGIPRAEQGSNLTQKFDQGSIRCNSESKTCEAV
jgi:D-alanyl-D-alanine carboxypeptidase